MWNIARLQILDGLNDARFVFASLIVLVAFILNGIIYSDKIIEENENWQRIVNTNEAAIQETSENLQRVSDLSQPMTKPYPALSFVADDGPIPLVNTLMVDAFTIGSIVRNNPVNEQMPFLPAFDWVFITTTFMTILCILLAYGAVCGEKETGTLKQVLSHPISRMQFFAGKLMGLVVTVTIVLFLGMLLSLMVLLMNNALNLTVQISIGLLWAFVLSVVLLTLFLLISMFVSSLVSQSRVSLIILLVIWVVVVIIIPGTANLLGEQLVEVPTKTEIARNLRDSLESMRASHPDDAGYWNGDMTEDFMPRRMALHNDLREVRQKSHLQTLDAKIQQARSINILSWISPIGQFKTFMQEVSNTGVNGFETLLTNARQYINSFESYVKQIDAADADSPHLVYHSGNGVETGTFSTKEVDPSTIPRWTGLWSPGGMPKEETWPSAQLLLLVVAAIQVGILAIWAFYRYDPR